MDYTLDPPLEVHSGARADASVIWLHGLGADGSDFAGIVPQLGLPDTLGIRFIFPHAPLRPVTINQGYVMRAWYDIHDAAFTRREDSDGIRAAASAVERLIADEIARGIPARRIVLAGFSQGGAVALHTGLRYPQSLGGIIALSTYLPLADTLAAEHHPANDAIAVLLAHGSHDDIVPLALAESACRTLQARGYPVDWQRYAMAHSVCMDEIRDIGRWLTARLGEAQPSADQGGGAGGSGGTG